MQFKKIVRPLLISALIFGGLGIAATPINARRVRYYHIHNSRIKRSIRGRQIRRPKLKLINRHNYRRYSKRHPVKQRHMIKSRQHIKSVKQPKKGNPRQTKRFPTVNNHTRDLKNARWESWGHHHRETVKSYSGPKMQFKTLRFLPLHINGTHFVQSIAVTPNGHYAYVGCDAYPYLSGYTRIARINLQRKHGGIKAGPRFYGGHGQALAYNPKSRQLWLLVDPSGPLHRGTFDQISTRSLKPIKHVKFHVKRGNLGDVLTFDNQGNAYNENRIWPWDASRQYKHGNVILYKGQLNRRHAKFNQIKQGIRRAPGYIIQGIAYNQHTKRLYLETDDAIMSIPSQKLGKLKPRDVKESILHGHREYEGISFDKSGHAYIVMARPNEILKSTKAF